MWGLCVYFLNVFKMWKVYKRKKLNSFEKSVSGFPIYHYYPDQFLDQNVWTFYRVYPVFLLLTQFGYQTKVLSWPSLWSFLMWLCNLLLLLKCILKREKFYEKLWITRNALTHMLFSLLNLCSSKPLCAFSCAGSFCNGKHVISKPVTLPGLFQHR